MRALSDTGKAWMAFHSTLAWAGVEGVGDGVGVGDSVATAGVGLAGVVVAFG